MNTSTNGRQTQRNALAGALAALILAGAAPALWAQDVVSEPQTVFYGKVLGTASAQDFLVTTGKLAWTILRSDGVAVKLESSLYPLRDGKNTYSYRLNVPHSAIALGLAADPGGVPMPPVPQVHLHSAVTVDGQTAALLGPAGSTFTTEQLLRTATYRMDLGLDRAAVDSDGDGIPDWWEDLYGLDKQNPGDARTDFRGDGLSALDSYLRGLDPTRDARTPELLTDEIVVYPSGTTGLLLETADLDSSADQLVYTVTALSLAGTLSLRNAQANPEQPDAILAVGGTFTQADLQKGRVVYDRDGSGKAPGSFEVAVRDENPEHPAYDGKVQLLAYEPAEQIPNSLGALEARRLENYLDAEAGYVVLDGTALQTNQVLSAPSAGLAAAALADYLAAYGEDRPYKILGSVVSMSLSGGQRGDVLVAGAGGGTLAGGAGADWFVAESFAAGQIAIADFSVAEQDVLDLSRIPATPGAYAHRYLQVVQTAGVFKVQTDLDGNGVGFTNLAVSLPGLAAADADLYDLIESGRLLVGSLVLEPLVSVVATQPQASENGPAAGRIDVTRRGSLADELAVNLTITGSAQNGVDYQLAPTSVIFPAGVAQVEVPIVPYADGLAEPAEVVQVAVAAGTGYRIGTASQASVTIEDLLMLVEIEAVEPIAVKDTASPGMFQITRRDVIDRDAVIRLTIGGTAANGTDYNALSTLVYMVPHQTVALLQIVPKAGAVLAGGMETVVVAIKPDSNYRVATAGQAQVAIVERADSFAAWRLREFPGVEGDVAAFAAADEGNTGISHFQRYAFGLDPRQPDPGGLPRLFRQDGKVGVTFRKPVGIADVQYRVVATANLLDWNAQSLSVAPMAAPAGSDDPAQVYYEVLAGDAPSVYIGVEVKWLP